MFLHSAVPTVAAVTDATPSYVRGSPNALHQSDFPFRRLLQITKQTVVSISVGRVRPTRRLEGLWSERALDERNWGSVGERHGHEPEAGGVIGGPSYEIRWGRMVHHAGRGLAL